MQRIDFIKKGLLGTGIFAVSNSFASLIENDVDELHPLNILGFNHLPNTESKIMSNTVLHKSNSRGNANHGWLQSYHTFSFANYYNPERMHFGVLRVLNDDTVAPGMGFGTHPHDNMEIISIPLEGDLEHRDSMGNVAVIKNGDIQILSAGTGITHSEYNKNEDKTVKFLQIWVFPNKKNIQPSYDQLTLKTEDRLNKLQQIVSPSKADDGVFIQQDAWFHLGKLDKDISLTYQLKKKGNGVYAFILNGEVSINEQELYTRDGFGVWDTDSLQIKANTNAEILLMDVPMGPEV
ncbi:pirin family protein [Ferruginibacter lapsinanis]|uniref:pirin family protein n=1 Tax=Ferruginibacter lapsinanis TaxID=563172 RepID=UPI001E56FF19|nr:pirin family protein [Ferruginibacter lapsinanis]UEG50338.1 pirin family protein [Ferruginibacter lapsinanis]